MSRRQRQASAQGSLRGVSVARHDTGGRDFWDAACAKPNAIRAHQLLLSCIRFAPHRPMSANGSSPKNNIHYRNGGRHLLVCHGRGARSARPAGGLHEKAHVSNAMPTSMVAASARSQRIEGGILQHSPAQSWPKAASSRAGNRNTVSGRREHPRFVTIS